MFACVCVVVACVSVKLGLLLGLPLFGDVMIDYSGQESTFCIMVANMMSCGD